MCKDLAVADPEALRIQLQQAIELIRSYMTLSVQSLGFFITADALLIAYGLSQRKSGIILMAALAVIGMLAIIWRGAEIMIPATYVAMRTERVLLPGQATLVNAYMGLRMRAAYEKLDAALGGNEGSQESYRKAAVKIFSKSRLWISVTVLFLFQIGLFVGVLTVANYPLF